MEFTGLIHKYPVNRLLRDEERELQLRQDERLTVEPSSQLCAIRLNSTYLEIVDKYFAWKGMLTLLLLGGFCVISIPMLAAGVNELLGTMWHWLDTAATFAFAILIAAVCGWFARYECFRQTHYPIRFNRKSRMVHVFRTDGTVFSVAWDKVFFCLGRGYQPSNWEVQGHVLADDGVTVLETFSLSESGVNKYERDVLKHFWQYVRDYMEVGPESVLHKSQVMLPITQGRETFVFGWHRLRSQIAGVPVLILFGALMTYIFIYPGRWLAMATSRIPVWPQEIEAQCPVATDDPCVRDARTNPS